MSDTVEDLRREVTDWRLEAEVHRKRAAAAVEEVHRLRLTDAEREAVEWFAAGDETCYGWGWKRRAETLRGLLERLEGGRHE